MKFWRHMAAVFAVCLALVLLSSTAEAAGGQVGAFTYELKGNGTAVITKFDWDKHSNGDVYVPRMVDGYTVTEIGSKAFTTDSFSMTLDQSVPYGNITSEPVGKDVVVIIPDTVKTISDLAFYGTRITSCPIPTSVQNIGYGAFMGCVNIRQFSVASGNSTFAVIDGVLYNKRQKELVAFPLAYSETEFTVPSGINSIGAAAFAYAGRDVRAEKARIKTNISTIIFPASVTVVQQQSFNGALLTVEGDMSHITHIGDYAFADAYIKMQSQTKLAPEIIGNNAFYKVCNEPFLQHISFNNLKQLGSYAFYDVEFVDSLFQLSQASITEIPHGAFGSINKLQSSKARVTVSFPSTLEVIGGWAYASSSHIIVTIPKNVQTIQSYAFGYTYNISVSFSEDSELTSIDSGAFYQSCFDSDTIVLPEGLLTIGEKAFYTTDDESKFSILSIPSTVTFIGDEVVDRSTIQLKVIPGSYAEQWALDNGYSIHVEDDTSWLFE